MNHVHHDLIVAWAKGAKIEWRVSSDEPWEETDTPGWHAFHLYRIKPEPKPDVVLYGCICIEKCFDGVANIQNVNATSRKIETDTCMFIFDGETGKLKDAQVLVSSKE